MCLEHDQDPFFSDTIFIYQLLRADRRGHYEIYKVMRPQQDPLYRCLIVFNSYDFVH